MGSWAVTLDVRARVVVVVEADSWQDAEYAYVVRKLGAGAMQRLFRLETRP